MLIELIFLLFSDMDLRTGISEEKRDRTLRTYIHNFYQFHLNEIFYVLRCFLHLILGQSTPNLERSAIWPVIWHQALFQTKLGRKHDW